MELFNYRDRRPIYEQITESYQEQILMGILEQEEKMPSVRALATELSINPNTIQRAYGELERQGYIYSVKGKGSFVSDVKGMRRVKRLEVENHLVTLARKAKTSGMTCEEFKDQAGKAYESCNQEKGGNGYD
ncbi:GntR family transcriptional regulator [Lachnoclostridium edouardi]|uniref:GntR family transcriptional regulator n=1 Tax=Lachnoclostridium edouardi TaxID=1926283 RepID=UPI000C7DF399|nr:GntR family transcriptional regulator [Lachnoclostridium edouardi]MDO4277701.1 GntR family transcriptional regulator [Lachnoclostridium edouardi]